MGLCADWWACSSCTYMMNAHVLTCLACACAAALLCLNRVTCLLSNI